MTEQPSALAASTASTVGTSCATGAATTASVGAVQRAVETRRLVDRAALGRDGERPLVRVIPGDVVPALPGGEPDRGADQAGADDGNAHGDKARGSSVAKPARLRAQLIATMAAWPWIARAGRTNASTQLAERVMRQDVLEVRFDSFERRFDALENRLEAFQVEMREFRRELTARSTALRSELYTTKRWMMTMWLSGVLAFIAVFVEISLRT